MKNYEIIDFINHYCANEEEWDDYLNTDLVFAVVAHGYLYVRPGEDTEEFSMKIMNGISSAVDEGVKNYLGEDRFTWPFEKWIRIALAKSALAVAREAFDADYFEEQCARLDPNEQEDGEYLLIKYLNLMDKEQLADFEGWINEWKTYYYVFTTIETRHEVQNHFNEICRKIDPSIPAMDNERVYFAYMGKHREFNMYDYLSKEEMVEGISKEIIFDRSLAGHMARIFYNTHDTSLIEIYIELVSHYRSIFNRDIYVPYEIFYETIYL
jgi:hypothetical protein